MNTLLELGSFLERWPQDGASAPNNVRVGRGDREREVNLSRQPVEFDSDEADDRPEVRQIRGGEAVLDFQPPRNHGANLTRAALIFELTPEESAVLFDEARVLYHRLILLFPLKDWSRAELEAAQILRLLDHVRQHALRAETRGHLEPWRPHLTRLHAVARIMSLIQKKKFRDACQFARDTFGPFEERDAGGLNYETIEKVLLDRVQDSLVAVPALHPGEENCFSRRGDFWKVRYQGQAVFLKSTRGLHSLGCLLRSPGREFHVSELLAGFQDAPVVGAPATANITKGRRQEDGDQFVTCGFADGHPILDAQAKVEYQRRLNELREERAEAEQCNDPERAGNARDEIETIAQHLAAAVGLGGRDRKTSSEAERARCAVTKRIKKDIQRIGDAIPALGHHLAASIKTGYFCSYHPNPDRPLAWKF